MATEERPVWLLDVDGVINANRAGWSRAPRRADVYDGYRMWRLHWEPRVIDFIRTTADAGTVEVTWCSTWVPHARELERLWNLPELAVAWTDPSIVDEAVGPAKHEAVRRVLAEGRRLIWTDDVQVPLPRTELHEELTAGGRALLIRPATSRGLRLEHVEQIAKWIYE